MSTPSNFSDDVCRNRYDHLVFGIGAPSSSSWAAAGAGASHGVTGAGAATRGDGSVPRERKWLLELGAMTVLEAELETLSVDGRAESQHSRNMQQAREREWYKSCLDTLLDDHYDTFGEKRAISGPSTVEARKRGKYTCAIILSTIFGRLNAVDRCDTRFATSTTDVSHSGRYCCRSTTSCILHSARNGERSHAR